VTGDGVVLVGDMLYVVRLRFKQTGIVRLSSAFARALDPRRRPDPTPGAIFVLGEFRRDAIAYIPAPIAALRQCAALPPALPTSEELVNGCEFHFGRAFSFERDG
jgi:hypothetical protein